jgi:hypothetical protein
MHRNGQDTARLKKGGISRGKNLWLVLVVRRGVETVGQVGRWREQQSNAKSKQTLQEGAVIIVVVVTVEPLFLLGSTLKREKVVT